MTSETSGSGAYEWFWTDGTWWCEGGYDISLAKGTPNDGSATYDVTGTWTITTSNHSINQGNSGDCTGASAHSSSVTIDQTGDSFTATGDGKTFSGDVSSANYTGSTSYASDGGTITESIDVTMTSETSGSGEGAWRWTDGTWWCSGAYDISFAKGTSGGGGGGGSDGGLCFISTIKE